VKKQQIERLNRETLDQLERFTNMPVLVFNEHGVLYYNAYYPDAIHENTINPVFHNLYNDIDHANLSKTQEVHIKNSLGEVYCFDATLKRVVFENTPAIYALLVSLHDEIEVRNELYQIEKLRELIIEISNSILDDMDIDQFYEYILSTALKAIDKTTLGTILVLDGAYLYPVASVGFSDEVMSLKIKLDETFIYQATKGKMDRIVNIPDLSLIQTYIKIKTEYGDEVQIESTLSAPFHFKGNLFGFINIDSLNKNAFNASDIKSIEFIVKSIEIAITNRLLYEEKVYLSRYDRVTGLYNRHFFDEQSNILIKKAKRYDESFHLIMIDIDNLKVINDQYSHLVGDEIIAQVAAIIKLNIRESDIFVRYGGDEFVGILFNFESQHIHEKFKTLSLDLSRLPIRYQNVEVHAEVSYGIAKFKEDGESIYELIRVADERMYTHKNEKKDRSMNREV
jgi:diguanylate cyclase (GGDEF)-like protein